MKKSENISLINSLLFFGIGLILFLNPNVVIKFISYCIGGVLLLVGAYKITNYYIQDKRLGVVNRNEMAFGITAVILGVVFIFLRFIVGGYLIISGLGKIMQTFYTTDRSSKFYALIVVGLIFIGAGLYTVIKANLPLSIIGLFMLVYGVINFVSYFVYKDKDNAIVKENQKEENVKEEKVIETELIEEKEESQTKKKESKKTETKKGRKKKD